MSATLAAGAIIGGASLLGSALGASSANSQNKLAEKQFNENMAFQKYQYQDAKRYNSLPYQVQQVRQAGINPSLLYGNGYSGSTVSSVGGSSPTAQRQPIDFSSLPSAAASMVSGMNETELVDSQQAANYGAAAKSYTESIGQSIDNQYKHGNNQLSQYLTRMQGQLAEQESAYQMLSLDARTEQAYWQSQLVRAEAGSKLVAAAWADKEHQSDYANVLAQTAAAVAAKKLTYQQAQQVLMNTIANYGYNKLDAYDLFNNSMDLIREQSNSERSKQSLNARNGSLLGLSSNALQRVYNKIRVKAKNLSSPAQAKRRVRISTSTGGIR